MLLLRLTSSAINLFRSAWFAPAPIERPQQIISKENYNFSTGDNIFLGARSTLHLATKIQANFKAVERRFVTRLSP
jgi:hypothetical protein